MRGYWRASSRSIISSGFSSDSSIAGASLLKASMPGCRALANTLSSRLGESSPGSGPGITRVK
ncbi:hypothetical protein D3C78_1699500 [compost metagenome]